MQIIYNAPWNKNIYLFTENNTRYICWGRKFDFVLGDKLNFAEWNYDWIWWILKRQESFSHLTLGACVNSSDFPFPQR